MILDAYSESEFSDERERFIRIGLENFNFRMLSFIY
jgi:hypothetical protein